MYDAGMTDHDSSTPTPAGAARATGEPLDPAADLPVAGDLPERWIHGSPRGTRNGDPAFQVHRYDPHTYVLRQSKALTAEAPFLYLLFGNERALLLDTGAVKKTDGNPLRETVDELIATWLDRHPREGYHLVVAHTHGHLDHVEPGWTHVHEGGQPGVITPEIGVACSRACLAKARRILLARRAE